MGIRWIATTVCAAALVACSPAPRYPVSDHFDGEAFHNPTRVQRPGVGRVLRHIVAGRRGAWPRKRIRRASDRSTQAPIPSDLVAVTFVNHSTVLLEFSNVTVLTDPVWSKRVGPGAFAGPKRARDPGIAFDDLPTIDVVVISHNHYDHLDLPTLRRLDERDQPAIFVPLGDRGWLLERGLSHVSEMDWWERKDHAGLAITFTPAQHNSGRGASDYNESLWGGYVLESGDGRVFFGGDTAYADHFSEIRGRFGPVDLALLPIGAYMPRDFTRAFHMDPPEAVQAMLDLQAARAVGIHYGTFKLTGEDFDAPPRELQQALEAASVPPEVFSTLREGETTLVALGG